MNCQVNDVDGNIEVNGNTYMIRNYLKERGAWWNPDKKVWYFKNSDVNTVQTYVDNAIKEREEPSVEIKLLDDSPVKEKRKSHNSPKTSDNKRPKHSRTDRSKTDQSKTDQSKTDKKTNGEKSKCISQEIELRRSPRKKGVIAPVIKEAPSYNDIEASLVEAKKRWNGYLERDNITDQKMLLKNAAIKMYYTGYKEHSPKYHTVIKYYDPKLETYAKKITGFLKGSGFDTTHDCGKPF